MIVCYRISYKLVHISGRLDQYKVQYFLFLLSEFAVKRHASKCTFRFHNNNNNNTQVCQPMLGTY